MQSHWITHKGKRIFEVDFSTVGFDIAAMQAEFDAVQKVLRQQPPGSVLLFSDSRHVRLTLEYIAMLKRVLADIAPYIRKQAVAGITERRRTLVQVFSKFAGPSGLQPFIERDEALDWLVQP